MSIKCCPVSLFSLFTFCCEYVLIGGDGRPFIHDAHTYAPITLGGNELLPKRRLTVLYVLLPYVCPAAERTQYQRQKRSDCHGSKDPVKGGNLPASSEERVSDFGLTLTLYHQHAMKWAGNLGSWSTAHEGENRDK